MIEYHLLPPVSFVFFQQYLLKIALTANIILVERKEIEVVVGDIQSHLARSTANASGFFYAINIIAIYIVPCKHQ